ncbi:metallo-dependent phosphatase-like protein [Vibrio phage 1.161.O._10N.261.48.C5]|nr:metallo-dependent phosphatase-like protein [Vibrio phage 1.161.O._10N.261.48.C5]
MSKKRLSDEKIVAILEGVFMDKKPNTQVALEVLGKKSKESSVRHIKRTYEKHGNYFGITLEGEINTEDDWKVPEKTLEGLCEHPDWNVSNLAKRLRSSQRSNNQLRKVQREAFDGKVIDFDEILNIYSKKQSVQPPVSVRSVSSGSKGLVMEVLFNDWQVAKRMSYYNTEIAIARVEEYTRAIIEGFNKKLDQGFTFDKIVVTFNGDIIEANKHDDSILASDRSPAEQLAIAIEVLTDKFLQPIAELGVEMDVLMISGNHDWNGRGMMAYEAGKHQLSYPMYRAMEMLLEAKGYSHVNCIIPAGWYYVHNFLGKNVLYEHGVGVASSEAAMRKRMQQRGQQLQKHIHYVRFADKHHSQRHHNDTVVLAGAFFGRCDDDGTGSEYSAAAGYAADPSQLVFFHQARAEDDYRNTIIDSLEVQLGHINHKTLKGESLG